MATGTIQNNAVNIIGIGGYWSTIGRADGALAIVVHLQGKFSSFSLSQTTNISVDVYGNKAYGNVTCSLDSEASELQSDGSLFLKFTPSSSVSGYVDTGKPCLLNLATKVIVTLTR